MELIFVQHDCSVSVVEGLLSGCWRVVEVLLHRCCTVVSLLLKCRWMVVKQLLNCLWYVLGYQVMWLLGLLGRLLYSTNNNCTLNTPVKYTGNINLIFYDQNQWEKPITCHRWQMCDTMHCRLNVILTICRNICIFELILFADYI